MCPPQAEGPAGSTPARDNQSWSPSIFATAGRWSKTPETSATRPGALLGRVLTQDQSHGHTITADNRENASG
jgi:hypothetical protein